MGRDEDVKVRVRLDSDEAEQRVQRLGQRFQRLAGGATRALGRGGALGLTALFGGTTKDISTGILSIADTIGRGALDSFAGVISTAERPSEFIGGLSGTQKAIQRTADVFGIAGRNADPEAVKGVFRALERIEQSREKGRGRVRAILGEEVGTGIFKDLKFAIDNFTLVGTELLKVFKLR